MTNEWAEFKDYTDKPQYISAKKSDKTYMGRFTFDMIKDFTGFNRIFTILARGYLFHDRDGNLLPGDPYERIELLKEQNSSAGAFISSKYSLKIVSNRVILVLI